MAYSDHSRHCMSVPQSIWRSSNHSATRFQKLSRFRARPPDCLEVRGRFWLRSDAILSNDPLSTSSSSSTFFSRIFRFCLAHSLCEIVRRHSKTNQTRTYIIICIRSFVPTFPLPNLFNTVVVNSVSPSLCFGSKSPSRSCKE
jgi:hypothetical protein